MRRYSTRLQFRLHSYMVGSKPRLRCTAEYVQSALHFEVYSCCVCFWLDDAVGKRRFSTKISNVAYLLYEETRSYALYSFR